MRSKKMNSLCEPIKKLVQFLIEDGNKLQTINLIDHHFKDFEILFDGRIKCDDLKKINIEGIEFDKEKNVAYCTCHWSYVKCN